MTDTNFQLSSGEKYLSKQNKQKRIEPALKHWSRYIDEVLLRLGPPTPDTICQIAAIQIGRSLCKQLKLPRQCGSGWNLDCGPLFEGYLAAKRKLPRFDPSIGSLRAFLHKTIWGTIMKTAWDDHSPIGKRSKLSKEKRERLEKTYPWGYWNQASFESAMASAVIDLTESANNLGLEDDIKTVKDPSTIEASAEIGELTGDQILHTVQKRLSKLSSGDREVIETIWGLDDKPKLTIAALARHSGWPRAALDRKVRGLLLEMRTCSPFNLVV